MTELMNVDEFVQNYDSTFAGFVAIYEKKNPPPAPPAVPQADRLTLFGFGLLVAASLIVSGSRTVVEFSGAGNGEVNLIGLAAFVMLEAAMIFYAYWRARNLNDRRVRRVQLISAPTAGVAISFAVLIGGNIDQTFKLHGIVLPQWVEFVISMALAISAPLLGLIAGDLFGATMVKLQRQRDAATHEFQRALDAWQTERNAAWDRQKARWGVRLTDLSGSAGEVREVHEIPREVHEMLPSPKRRVKLHEVAREVHEAGDQELSADEMMVKYGISLGGTSKVRELVRAMNGGH